MPYLVRVFLVGLHELIISFLDCPSDPSDTISIFCQRANGRFLLAGTSDPTTRKLPSLWQTSPPTMLLVLGASHILSAGCQLLPLRARQLGTFGFLRWPSHCTIDASNRGNWILCGKDAEHQGCRPAEAAVMERWALPRRLPTSRSR